MVTALYVWNSASLLSSLPPSFLCPPTLPPSLLSLPSVLPPPLSSSLPPSLAPSFPPKGFQNDEEDCATDEEYDIVSQSNVYQAIKNVFSSKYCRKDFERNYLLDSSKSRALWETIAEMAEDYVLEIRKLLPLPQLVVVSVGREWG